MSYVQWRGFWRAVAAAWGDGVRWWRRRRRVCRRCRYYYAGAEMDGVTRSWCCRPDLSYAPTGVSPKDSCEMFEEDFPEIE